MNTKQSIKRQVDIRIGNAGRTVGNLIYVKQGRRENTTFVYDGQWLANKDRIKVSSDLDLISGYQQHKAASPSDSVFHFAFADTAPDAWGRRVIARDHAKRRKINPAISPLTEMDYLLAVDDFSRIGALRLRDLDGKFCRTVEQGQRATPPLLELAHMYEASRAVEQGRETQEDLRYLHSNMIRLILHKKY